MGKYNGKVVIITGAGKSGGIGYGIATAFAKEGADLVVTGRRVQPLEDAKEELERLYGVRVLPVSADGGKEEDAKRVIDEAVKAFGRIDVLINNAQNSASGVALDRKSVV